MKQLLFRQMVLVAFTVIVAAGASFAAEEERAEGRSERAGAEGIIVEPNVPPPPAAGSFDVDVWTDQRVYEIGDLIRIYFRVTRPAYVYIFDTDTRGVTRQIFPNYYDNDPYVVPGRRYYIPDSSYRLRVTGPPGIEHVRVVAVRERPVFYQRQYRFSPADPFPRFEGGARGFIEMYEEHESERAPRGREGAPGLREDERREGDRGRIRGEEDRPPARRMEVRSEEARVESAREESARAERAPERREAREGAPESIVVEPREGPRAIVVEPYERDYAEAYTSFRIVDSYGRGGPVAYSGRIEVTSDPPGARVLVDGVLRGYTPTTIRHLEPGYHDVTINLRGYHTWSDVIEVREGRTANIDVPLRQSSPRFYFDFRWGP